MSYADVYLRDDYLAAAEEFAVAWTALKGNSPDDHFWPQGAPSSHEAIRRGFLAEAGLCQWLGLAYAPTVHPGGDGGIDLVLLGRTIQVKATLYASGGLMFDSHEHFKAQAAVLMHLNVHDLREQCVLGWHDREEYLEEATWESKNAERPPRLYLAQERLWSAASLPREVPDPAFYTRAGIL